MNRVGSSRTIAVALFALLTLAAGVAVYPIDGYEATGIRRLERLRLIVEGKLRGRMPPPGARKERVNVVLHHAGDTSRALPAVDPELQAALTSLFRGRDPNYSLALADITPGRTPRYAAHRPNVAYQPGSVGKLAIAAGLFAELARIFPDDEDARRRLLKEHVVQAGDWAMPNHHTIPIFDLETYAFQSRAVRTSDTFSLFEWADHALSASSNAAATVLWREVLLMRAFGASYPPGPEETAQYFAQTPKAALTTLAIDVVNTPLRDIGISEDGWRLGTFFTTNASRYVPGRGGSTGTVEALIRFLFAMERGQIVDEWSSLELKRLMYSTERRIRYAASPVLDSSAVYYKSGSLYKCQQEEGFECTQYHGNVYNYMNSVGEVETTDGRVYLAVLMSNVLRKNSAYEHSVLAGQVDRIVRGRR